MTAIEHKELKGITIKNLVVTVVSTASIVVSVMTSYYQLRSDIHDVKSIQDTQSRVNEIRLKILENNVAVLQQQVNQIKNQNQIKHL
ncbi:hypothetical protein [Mucilaginibacter sp.]|uniref:hypothetical protein n=1 Tax=Mucilaginibacter sp. TaxID=1882438 RepID=UPI00262BCF73|nr:hypothetical protein [Mucilaginibacter sp.]MDB4926766.1 hypothetical protein [Mucilaginibacter sp.]